MKRQTRLIVAAVILLGLVSALVMLQRDQSAARNASDALAARSARADTDRELLFDNPRDELSRIIIERRESHLALQRDDAGWKPEYRYDVDWAESRIDRIVSGAAILASRRKIGAVSDPGEYGFEQPTAVITTVLKDGTQFTLQIGNRTPGRDGYYVKRRTEEDVYIVYAFNIAPFLVSLDDLRVKALATPQAQQISRIVLETPTDTSTQRIVIEPNSNQMKTPELANSPFIVTQPYGHPRSVNSTWLTDFSESLKELQILRYVDDAPDDLARYGLDPPIATVFVESGSTTLHLQIGEKTDDGHYARRPENESVFVLAGAKTVIDTQPIETVGAFALLVNIELLDRMTVTYGDSTLTARIGHADNDSHDQTDGGQDATQYYLNEQPVTEDAFKDMYQRLISLQFDAENPDGPSPPDGKPLASITYELRQSANADQPDALSVAFVPVSDSYLAVVRDGTAEFLIARRKVERSMRIVFETASP